MTLVLLRIGFLVVVVWLGLRWFEWRNLYAPSRVIDSTPQDVGLDFEDVEFVAEDGVRLHGWWIPHPAARGTILYCHGNGLNIANRVGICRDLHALGVNLFIFDYRGYGQSKGFPSEKGTYRDARAAYEVVRARYDDAENPPVIVYGVSLGAAIAAQLAMDKPVRGAILEAGFTSVVDVGERLFPWLPVRWVAVNRYDAAERVARLTVPKLFASSRDDQLIPFDLGYALFTAAAEPKQFYELRGSHDEGGWNQTPGYWPVLSAFIDSVLGPQK
ncbi:MAG: alpha/beta hydrolase [Kiritimatiellae bacterium]|nr:alpha/beta hydrolase [Kiritimatiellia bacterium]MDW8457850.1 alpha/beta hydrolase [Verrucomicrobiota bacterium]